MLHKLHDCSHRQIDIRKRESIFHVTSTRDILLGSSFILKYREADSILRPDTIGNMVSEPSLNTIH
ncbi:hypothetical protein K432DRAFT_384523 [Lepidopterella palustris CBS 459.81]|uniref:Uncharacterized protein n=1 Tax=Lepidopterella palustris CBS 459.81 TaxID=1314670 RepID=A0A8E2E5F9_9PEZI|nr:hypothetical protein K432DRAFT_384523 [Lepidopterella palustris CBS 459.81]